MEKMRRPIPSIVEQNRFSPTEVGITHQFTNGFFRISDNGDIEIVAGEGIAIILHPQNRSITFVADKIKFITKDRGGMIWNKKQFNEKAFRYTEPALVDYEPEAGLGIYRGSNEFVAGDDE